MKPRVALYSHDAQGMGHMRRNLALAGSLVEEGRRSALLIAGAREASTLPMPPGVECITLPAFAKSVDGAYSSRSLDLSLSALLRLRAETISAVLEAFEPDVFIVDKHPLGFRGELQPGLELLRARGGTRLVLGLREVLDDPAVVRADWDRDDTESAIRELYDRVWVYGDKRVYDPVREYAICPSVAAKVRYTGYLAPALTEPPVEARDPLRELDLPADRMALCLIGGGQDGAELAAAFVRAPLPGDMAGVVVAGPFLPADARRDLHAVAAQRRDLRVLDTVQEPQHLLWHAERVVAMGGYNTVCEILAAHRPALIVPRDRPRVEQLLRARRLSALGVLDVLAAGALSPAALGAWLARDHGHRPHAAELIDLDGLRRVPRLMADLLSPATNEWEARRLAA
jgi:predicted glycosyltransferase